MGVKINTAVNISGNSYVSAALVGSIITLTWSARGVLAELHLSLELLNTRLLVVEKAQFRPDPWTGEDMYRWTMEFGNSNPALKIPSPLHHPL